MRASSTDRAVVCPHSLIAPSQLTRRTKTEEAADTGTLLHLWVETGEEHPAVARKILSSGFRREEYWPPGQGEHEVTFAINLRTLELQRPSAKVAKTAGDEWKTRFDPALWLTGTMDWLGVDSGVDWVDDLKTGNWPVDPLTGQLLSYALVPWILKGRPESDYQVQRSITWWPWYPLSAWPKRTWADPANALDLLCHVQDLRYAAENPDKAVVVPPVYHPTKKYKDGRRAVEEMSPCTFCDGREPHRFSSWMQHFQHRANPTCLKGALSTIDWENKL